jgi:mono/diheme cytochrome c family protein
LDRSQLDAGGLIGLTRASTMTYPVEILSPYFSKRGFMRSFANSHARAAAMILLPAALLSADVDTKFHNAPASAQAVKNPYAGQEEAAQAGKELYTRDCLSCHGQLGHGTSY